jgi:hypothetical protein
MTSVRDVISTRETSARKKAGIIRTHAIATTAHRFARITAPPGTFLYFRENAVGEEFQCVIP